MPEGGSVSLLVLHCSHCERKTYLLIRYKQSVRTPYNQYFFDYMLLLFFPDIQ